LDELVLARQAVLNLPAHSPKAEVTAACLRYAEENVAFGPKTTNCPTLPAISRCLWHYNLTRLLPSYACLRATD